MTRLVAAAAVPTLAEDVDLMLRYRDVVVDSFRQRLHDLGCLPNVDREAPAVRDWTPYSDDMIPFQLAAVASRLPRMQDPDGPAPSDVFARRSTNICVDQWRTAALESLAASTALSGNVASWASTESRWLVLRDIAVGLEAVVVLDDGLREVGLLNQHDAPRAPAQVEDTRAVLAQAARVTSWRATTHDADGLAPRTRPDLAKELHEHGPVRLVRELPDLAAAQERLARALTPMTAQNTSFAGEPHLSARAARHLVIGQLLVTRVGQQMLSPGSDRRTEVLATRTRQLSDVDRHLTHLVDHDPGRRMAGTLIYWQQAEITTSLLRLDRCHALHPLTPAQQTALDEASASACRQLAVALRRELLRDDSNLRLADPAQQVGPTRVHRRSPLERALTELVNTSAVPARREQSVSVQRAVLQHTVDTSPTPTIRRTTLDPTRARGR